LQQFLDDDLLRERIRAGTCATLTDQFSLENFQSHTRAVIRELSGSDASRMAPASGGDHVAWM
jgi:hypothetical protein